MHILTPATLRYTLRQWLGEKRGDNGRMLPLYVQWRCRIKILPLLWGIIIILKHNISMGLEFDLFETRFNSRYFEQISGPSVLTQFASSPNWLINCDHYFKIMSDLFFDIVHFSFKKRNFIIIMIMIINNSKMNVVQE